MALEPPQELVQQHDQHENVVFLVSRHDGTKKNERCPQKLISGQKTSFFDPKRAILGNWGQKMARRATKRPHTRIPKVSRVTSGYGGLMIPLIRIHLTPKNGGYMGENGDFRAGGHWEKLRSSETKRATTDRLVPKRPQFRWLRSRKF